MQTPLHLPAAGANRRAGAALLAVALACLLLPAGGRCADAPVDDFAGEAPAGWSLTACVWKDGRSLPTGESPFRMTLEQGALRLEFASGTAEKYPSCYGLWRKTPAPAPPADTDTLAFWVFREAGAGRIKAANLFNGTTWEQFQTRRGIPLDFSGWRQILLRQDDLLRSGKTIRWEDIDYLQFVVEGDFVIHVSGMRWTTAEAAAKAAAPTRTPPVREIPVQEVLPTEAASVASQPHPAGGKAGFAPFARSPVERCSRNTLPRPGEGLAPLRVAAAPGEFEPATLLLRAYRPMRGVSLRPAGDLRAGANRIPASAVDVRVVTPMTRCLDTRHYQRIEYLLMKRPSLDLPAGNTARFWITVHVPSAAPPGRYRGQLLLAAAGRQAAAVVYEVDVLPFRLPDLDDMNHFMYFRPGRLPKWAHTTDYLEKCLHDMRDHGMTGFSGYVYPARGGDPVRSSMAPSDMAGPFSLADTLRALKKTRLLKPGSGAFLWIAAAIYGPDVQKAFVDELQRAGCRPFFYAIDEPDGGEERLRQVRTVVPRLKRDFPQIGVTTAIGRKGIEAVGDLYDAWICGAAALDDALAARAAEKGKTLWSYECGLAPVDPLTVRHYFGPLLWRTGAKGGALWAYSDASAADRFGLPVTEWAGYDERLANNYDYVCCLPEGPVPSAAWEMVREGIDDTRYLRLLETLIADARKGGRAAAAAPAEAFLRRLRERIHPEKYTEAAQAARRRAEEKSRFDIGLFERGAPEPGFSAAEYDRVRREVTQQILALRKARNPGGGGE